jgi:Beta-propeller repeat
MQRVSACACALAVSCGALLSMYGPNALGAPFVFQTTIPDAGFEAGRDLAVDAGGATYVAARSYDRNNDVLIVKLDAAGRLVWRRSLAGARQDYATGLALDANADVYVVGTTQSTDFPAVNASQSTLRGNSDAFIAKLSGQTGQVIFSTFFGGSRNETGDDIVVRTDGTFVITGSTGSTDLATANPLQAGLNLLNCFCNDAFVAVFAPNAAGPIFSTYFGGSGSDAGISVDAAPNGDIYIAGVTTSRDLPLANAQDASFGGDRDAFVARIAGTGASLQFSTYLGGAEWDYPRSLAVNGAGEVVVVGETRSPDFPTTVSALQRDFVGGLRQCSVGFGTRNCNDAFATRFAADGTAAFSTFLGGVGDDQANDVAFGADGRIHLIGSTPSGGFPPLAGQSPSPAIFVADLNASGSTLLNARFIQSASPADGHAITADDAGGVYVAGAQNAPSDLYVAKLATGAGAPPGGEDPPATLALRSSAIDLSLRVRRWRQEVNGVVTVSDAAGAPVANAEVSIGWQAPYASAVAQRARTDARGKASFAVQGWRGEYVLTVEDISKEGYVFDAQGGLSSKAIAP